MRKKLFAVLAVQIAAVTAILGFSYVYRYGLDKYGKVYTQKVSLNWLYQEEYDDSIRYTLEFSSEEINEELSDILLTTKFISKNSEIIRCYDEDISYFQGSITLTETATAKAVYDLYLSNVLDLQKISSVYDTVVSFAVFAGRTELTGLTIDGKPPEEFFKACLNGLI